MHVPQRKLDEIMSNRSLHNKVIEVTTQVGRVFLEQDVMSLLSIEILMTTIQDYMYISDLQATLASTQYHKLLLEKTARDDYCHLFTSYPLCACPCLSIYYLLMKAALGM